MSLHRLIALAQKTGDRLIVHDPVNGRDVVLLSVQSYEQLVEQGNLPGKNIIDQQDFFSSIEKQIADWSEDKTLFEQELFWDHLTQSSRRHAKLIDDEIHPEHNWHSIADVLGYEQKYHQEYREEDAFDEVPPYNPPEEEPSLDPQLVPLESVESPREKDQELTYEIPIEQEPLASDIPAMPPERESSQARERMNEGLSEYKGQEPISGNMNRSSEDYNKFESGKPLGGQAHPTPPIFFDEPV